MHCETRAKHAAPKVDARRVEVTSRVCTATSVLVEASSRISKVLRSRRAWRRGGHQAAVYASICAVMFTGVPLRADTFYWDADGSVAGNNVFGDGLGGSGAWNTADTNWWDTTNLVEWPNTDADQAIFSGPLPTLGIPTASTVTVSPGIVANQLSFRRSGYLLTGGSITLAGAAPSLQANVGEYAVIESLLQGTDGLTLTGGGSIRLSNSANSYGGFTTIANGSVVISDTGALGTSTSAVVVSGSATQGFGGGTLVLDGVSNGAGVQFTRDLVLQGYGPTTTRNVTLNSVGNNTVSGAIQYGVGNLATGINSVGGMLTISGSLTSVGTTGLLRFGIVNSVGAGGYHLTGGLYNYSTGGLEKTGGGTLILDPTAVILNGTVNITGGSLRVSTGAALGTSVANNAVTLGGGVGTLEIRTDLPETFGTRRVSMGGSGNATIFLDHAVGSDLMNQTVKMGPLTLTAGSTTRTLILGGRNGYGLTFVGNSVGGAIGGSNTIQIDTGGLVTFDGNFWNNTATTARTLTMTVNTGAQAVITGSVIASGADHILAKSGAGTLTILGTDSTYSGATNISNGALVITDFRSITNNTAAISLGNATTTAGNLIIGGTGVTPTAEGLKTNKTITLNTTTASNSIYANQTGSNPVEFNGAITKIAATTTGNLILGGTNTADNVVNAAIPGTGTGGLIKLGSGTWVLAASNAYVGATTIQNGTLKLRADAAASDVIKEASTNTVVFSADSVTQSAGGRLEFHGLLDTATSETLGALTPTAGTAKIAVSANGTGTAALAFTSLGTRGAGAAIDYQFGAGASISFGTLPAVTNGILGAANVSAFQTFNGVDWATLSGSNVVQFTGYTDIPASFSGTAGATVNYSQSVDAETTGAASINTLKLIGGVDNPTLTLGDVLTLTGRAILFDNSAGVATITGGQLGAASTEVHIITNGGAADNALTIDSPISSGTGSLTKSGTGTLIIGGNNAFTGNVTINEGVVQLSGPTAALGVNSTAGNQTIVRQGATLDINAAGASQTTHVGALVGAGVITNSGGGTGAAGTISFGRSTSTGTTVFSGVLQDGDGVLNVIVDGTTARTQSFMGLSTYTGFTQLATGAQLTVDVLADGGVASGIGASSNAASNLVFSGSGSALIYRGNVRDGSLNIGSASTSTNRLFTITGTGATLSSTAAANNAIVWSNTGAIEFGGTESAKTLTLAGTSLGDNRINLRITDSGTGENITSLVKSGAGLWVLGNVNNTYSGQTIITDGILQAQDGTTLSANSALMLGGTTSVTAVFQSSGVFSRELGTSAGQVTWNPTLTTGGGGFAASTDKLVVAIGGLGSETELVWGSGGFLFTGSTLVLNSTTALAEVEFRNAIDLAGSTRRVTVADNTSTFTDYATISGVISNSSGTAGLIKEGAGTLRLTGANTYNGTTSVTAGTLVVTSLGNSATPGASSLGDSSLGHTDAGALILGNATTTGGILQYIGPGETSDRKIRLQGTTANNQIHADGTGPLILTNVAHDTVATGNKTLSLRGSSTAGNMITSALTNNGTGVLTVTIDGGATWILSGNNTYTGNTNVTAGALGVGGDSAVGAGTLVLSNSSIFAHGGDRTVTNAVSLTANTAIAFLGDHSLTFGGLTTLTGTGTSSLTVTSTNNMAADKTLTFAGNVTSGAGANRTWTINGSGTTVITGDIVSTTAFNIALSYAGTGSLTLYGSNTTGGTTTAGGGVLRAANNAAFGSGGVTLINTNAVLELADGITIANTLSVSNTGNNKVLRLQEGAVSGEYAGNIANAETTSTNFDVSVETGGTLILSGVISGVGGLEKVGAGTAELTNANTFAGTATVSNGVLRLTGSGQWGAGAVTVANGRLEITAGGVDQTAAGLLTLGASTSTYAELMIGAGRTLTLGNNLTYTASNTATANPNPAVISGAGTLALGTGEKTITVGDNLSTGADLSWQMGVLTGSGTLIKAGAGTLDLSGITTNSFTGAYRIDLGAILGLNALSNNLILNGGVFEGSGTFTRSLGTGDNQVQWAAGTLGGGFSAQGGDLTVTLGGAPDPLVWGGTTNFAPDGAPLVFGSTSADSVVEFTHNIDLNGAQRTVSAVDNTTVTTDKAVLSGLLSNGSLNKTGTGFLELTGANTFTGVTVTAGTLQFKTVSDNGGGPSNLGQGDDGITLSGGILSFIGDGAANSQSTNRAINLTAASTLNAGGTNGATITYAGAITSPHLSLTLTGTGAGILSGVTIAPPASGSASADLVVASGDWTLTGGGSYIADDFLLNGGTTTLVSTVVTVNDDTIASNVGTVLNLNSTGVLTANNPAGTSSGLYSRNGAVINLNADDIYGVGNSGGLDFILLGDSGTAAIGTLNTNTFNLTTPRLDLGGYVDGLEGAVTGTGTLTLTGTVSDYSTGARLWRGAISANLAGNSTLWKLGHGEVTLSGDNSGLTGANVNSRLDGGTLILDYTTNNNSKIATNVAVDLRGGELRLIGNASGGTTQNVNGMLLNAGSSRVTLQHGGSEALTLSVGAITRNANGAVSISTSANSSVATSLADTPFLGGWAVINDRFAAVSGGFVVGATTIAKDDLATWTAGDNVVDDDGYFGEVGTLTIGSLVFESADDSTVTIGAADVLTLAGGGILVTSGSGAGVIAGGRLTSSARVGTTVARDLVIHQQNTANDFTIGSAIDPSIAVVKAGAGTLVLSGNNDLSSRPLYIGDGTVRARGGHAVGDLTVVTLSTSTGMNGVLDIVDSTETIGALAGGAAAGPSYGSVLLGATGSLTLDSYASTSFAAFLSGGADSTIIKNKGGTLGTATVLAGFMGSVVINDGGGIRLDGNTSGQDVFSLARSFAINGAGSHLISDQDQTAVMNLIANSAAISLANTAPAIPAAVAHGLIVVNTGSDSNWTETVGQVTLRGGHNAIFANVATGTNTARVATLTMASLVRQQRATLLLAGQNLGNVGPAAPSGRVTVTDGTVANLGGIGGAGAAGTTTMSIIPYIIGQAAATGTTETNLYLSVGNSLVTYDTNGFRPLNLTTEYVLNADDFNALAASTTDNVRFDADPGAALAVGSKTINSLVLDSSAEALTLTGDAADTLTLAGGALLATTTAPGNDIRLGGYSELRTGTSEYLIYVTNPTNTLTIESALTSSAALTKAGYGILALTNSANSYHGGTWFNQGLIEVSDLAALGYGSLNFNGGGLRWAAGASFDPSTWISPLNFFAGGATFDTNGNDVVIAGPVGNGGEGGLTKIGEGRLTIMSATAVDFAGAVTIAGGNTPTSALVYGVADALPATTSIALGIHGGLGGYLDFGNFTTTLAGLNLNGNSTISGAADLTFTGRVEVHGNAARTLTINNTGTTTFDGDFFVLVDRGGTARVTTINGTGDVVINSQITDGAAAAGSLTYTGGGVLQLTNANTYTGNTVLNNTDATLQLTGAGTLGAGNLTVNAGSLLMESVDQAMATLTMGGGAAGSSSLIDIGAGLTLRPNTITFSATGNNLTAVIGGAGTLDLGNNGYTVNIGDSTAADVDMSWEMDTVIGSGLFIKNGTGTLDISGVTNFNYNATGYQINAGAILGLDLGDTNLVLNGGVFEGNGTFTRSLGTGNNQVQWAAGTAGGGFSAQGGNLTVTLGGVPDPLVWGGTPFFVPSGAPLIFGSLSADAIVDFTHNIDLNAAVRTVSVVDNTFVTTDKAVLSGVLSNGGVNKTGTGFLELTGANTFTGVTVTAGTLQFKTVSDNGGGPSNLGQGNDGITLSGGILSFIGDGAANSQSTNRAINLTAASTLDASGTNGATITYAGAITSPHLSLTLRGTGAGIISGGATISPPASGTPSADIVVASGDWTFTGVGSSIADDFLLNGGTTTLVNTVVTVNDDTAVSGVGAVLNLNSSGVLAATNPAGTSSVLAARNGGVINLGADEIHVGGLDSINLGDATEGAAGVLNTNGFDITTVGLVIGSATQGLLEGHAAGDGTIRVTSTVTDWSNGIRTYRGEISANLAGVASLLKQGHGTVRLTGDNSGLINTVASTRIDLGNLILDYTINNNNKISSAAALDLRGGTLTLVGNESASTSQSVSGLVLTATTGSSSSIALTHGTNQTVTLNVGAITRNANTTIDFGFTEGSGMIVTTSANANGTILGGWATANARNFATLNFGTVAEFFSTPIDDIEDWSANVDVTDEFGYSGALGGDLTINSLRFGAAGATSTVDLGSNRLTVASGGILVTADVAAGAASIIGGSLRGTGGAGAELIVHQYNTGATFEIASRLVGATSLTKSGGGTLVLSGANTNWGTMHHNGGTLRLTNGSGVGFAAITLKNSMDVVLELGEGTYRTGGLAGGGTLGGVVQIGGSTLIADTSQASRIFVGRLEGDGTFIKTGVNSQELEGASLNFTGDIIINSGLLHLDSTSGRVSAAASITINAGSELLTDQDQSSAVDRIGNSTVVTLNNTANVVNAANSTRGLWIRADANITGSDTIGTVVLGAGHNVIQATTNGGTSTSRIADLVITEFLRSGHSTALVRGNNLGSSASVPRGRIRPATAPLGVIGGGGAAGTTKITIVPWLIGVDGLIETTSDADVALALGNSFVTWVSAGVGLRPLNLTTEYVLNEAGYNALSGVTADNVRFAINPAAALTGGSKTINSLVLDSTDAALTLTGEVADTLTLASGALLAATTAPANGITLTGFSELRTGTAEYLIYVTNATQTFTIDSQLTSTASLTKAGQGILKLTNNGNSYNGGTWFNQGFIEVADLGALGSGDLNFAGGGLRWASGSNFDPSARTLTFGTGGAIFDTNGNDVTVNNAVGNGGVGGLAKTGEGLLTINGTVNFSGPLTVVGGNTATSAVVIGAAGILPAGTHLVLGNGNAGALPTLGGWFDIGSFETTLANLNLNATSTIVGSAPLTFTGNVEVHGSASRTLTINNSGVTTFAGGLFVLVDRATSARTTTINGTGNVTINNSIVDGTAAGSLTYSGTATLLLTGDNSQSGTTTVSGGTLGLGNDRAAGIGSLTTGTASVFAHGGDRVIANLLQQSNGSSTTYTGDYSFTFTNTFALLASSSSASVTTNNIVSGKTLTFGNVTANALTATRNWTINGSGATRITGSITTSTTSFLNLIYTGTGSLSLEAANTALGATTVGSDSVAAGTLNVGMDSNIGGGNLNVFSGQLNLENLFQSIGTLTMGNGPLGSTSGIELADGGSLNLGGNVTYTASANSGTATVAGGTLNLLANRTFTINDSTATDVEMIVNSVIADGSGARTVTKAGTGTLVFGGANTYSGTTTLSAGSLRLTHNEALGATGAGTTVSGGETNTGILELAGGITVTGETLTLGGRTGATDELAHVRNVGGNNTWAGNVNFATGGTTYNVVSEAGLLSISGQISGATTTGDQNLRLRGAGDGVVSGNIVNGSAIVSVTKDGDGRWTLGGANTYTGATNINQGTLTVNGSIGGTAVTVGSATAATFNGSGTISAAVTVTTTGTMSAGSHESGMNGNGVGQMTLGSGLTWQDGSSLVFDFADAAPAFGGDPSSAQGTDWDFLNITGDLNINVTSTKITVYADSWNKLLDSYGATDNAFDKNSPESHYPTSFSYQWLWAQTSGVIKVNGVEFTGGDLSDYFVVDGSRDGTGALTFGAPNMSGGQFWVSSLGNSLYVNYSSVPEPGSMVLIGVAALGLAGYRRRKRRQAEADAENAALQLSTASATAPNALDV